jgi:hypothetical protein
MRTPLLAIIGVAWMAAPGVSAAAPVNAGAIGQAAEELAVTETVHCRPFRHWHRWGYSRGCGAGVYIDEGVRVRSRIGVHERFGVRSRIGVRDGFRGESRTGVTVRSGERGSVSGGASVRSSTSTPGETSVRSSGGRGPGSGGSMNTAPTGGGGGGGGTGQMPGGSGGNRQ